MLSVRKKICLAAVCLLAVIAMACNEKMVISADTTVNVKISCEAGAEVTLPVKTDDGQSLGQIRIACKENRAGRVQIEALELHIDGLSPYVATSELQDMYFMPELQGGDYDRDGQMEYLFVWFSGGTGGEYFSSFLEEKEGELVCISNGVWDDSLVFDVTTTNGGETFVVSCESTGMQYEIPGPCDIYQKELEVPENGEMAGSSYGITGIENVIVDGYAALRIEQTINGAGGNVDDIGCVISVLKWTEEGFELLKQEIHPYY